MAKIKSDKVVDVVAVASDAVAKTRKDTSNVPRITKAVTLMTQEQREVWFVDHTKACTVEQAAEVRARLDLLNAGKYVLTQGQGKGQGKLTDFIRAFERADMKTLLDLRATLETAIDAKRVEAIAEIAAAELELASRKAALAV